MANKDNVSIFIIDDDKFLSETLKKDIENVFSKTYTLNISTFEAGEQCTEQLKSKPDIAIVDYSLDSKYKDAMNGVQIIDMIKRTSKSTEIIMVTGNESAEIAMKAIHHGAHDYIVKNDHLMRKLNMSLLQCIKLKELKIELQQQKTFGITALIIITLIFGVLFTIQIIAPHIIN
jgi:DNA-binding NtrC family response regulator